MLEEEISEILLNLGNKLKSNPNDLMLMAEVVEKLKIIVKDMEEIE
ncbi:MAG: hypothetical protein ACRC7S_04090 [Cetobacterium sp.]